MSAGAYSADVAQAPGAAASTEPLEEVIVHARRRAEPLKDTPVAISVISGEQLREDSADTVQDVGRGIPNLRMVSSPQSVSALDVTMRGQTVNRSAIVFDSAVGLYVDGVYVANGQGAMATLLDVDSVEVARGSQGTLSGRNNTGGSISLTTHQPDLGADSIEVAASGGDYGEFMDRAIVNVPLSDTFAVRAAYQDNSRAGFGSSLGNGQDNLENQHRYTARFSALWVLGGATEAFFTYEHFVANEYGAVLHPLAGPAPGTEIAQLGQLFAEVPLGGLPTVQFPSDLYQTDGSLPGFDDARTDALQLTMSHRFDGGLSAKLILGFRRLDASTALDVDASPIPFADTTLYNTSNQKSAELQLADKAFDGQLDWVGGLYWFRDNGSAPSLLSPASPGFLAAVSQLDGLLQEETGQNPNIAGEFDPYPRYEQNSVVNSSDAAYLHGEYKITPDWAVAAGARYTKDQREIQENDYLVIPVVGQYCQLPLTAGGALPIEPCPDINKVADFGYWSWELSSHYALTPQWTAYARIGRSQRSGGWNAPLASYADTPFRPEQLTDYELGTKAELFDGALALNEDVFYGQYDEMQRLVSVLEPNGMGGGTPDTLVINAGNATVSGAEFDGHWRPMAHASVDASFGWTDAHYKTFMFTPIPGEPPENLAGNKFNESPPLQASLGASYEFVTAPGLLRFSADYAWQDKVEFNVINDFNYQGAYGTLNARVALASPSRSWEIAFYGTNLTNQHYAYNGGTITEPGLATPVIAWQVPGPMCMWVLEATYRWSTAR